MFKARGVTPIHVEIKWDRRKGKRCFDDYLKDFLKVYKKRKGQKVYVLGFSFGASVAFLTAPKAKPTALILCSLSPYFKEDLGDLPSSWRKWWKRNFTESDYSFDTLVPKVRCRVNLLVGNKELLKPIDRPEKAHKKLKNSKLVIIKGAKHDIRGAEYQKAIKRVISRL